jgi:hypothetical protein
MIPFPETLQEMLRVLEHIGLHIPASLDDLDAQYIGDVLDLLDQLELAVLGVALQQTGETIQVIWMNVVFLEVCARGFLSIDYSDSSFELDRDLPFVLPLRNRYSQ